MAELIFGDRIGRLGGTLVGGSCAVLNADRTELLLTRRSDNGRWCLPGGHFEPGESISETAVRETKEETGLDVEIVRLVGVYSDPNRLLEYADGNKFQIVALHFEGRVTGGELTLSDETTEFLWCEPSAIGGLDLMEHHVERISDTFADEQQAFVR